MIIPIKLTDEEKTKLCPKIILKGWWWKKYIPYYKKLSYATNQLFLHEWLNGGYESFEIMMDIWMDKIYLTNFPPINIKRHE